MFIKAVVSTSNLRGVRHEIDRGASGRERARFGPYVCQRSTRRVVLEETVDVARLSSAHSLPGGEGFTQSIEPRPWLPTYPRTHSVRVFDRRRSRTIPANASWSRASRCRREVLSPASGRFLGCSGRAPPPLCSQRGSIARRCSESGVRRRPLLVEHHVPRRRRSGEITVTVVLSNISHALSWFSSRSSYCSSSTTNTSSSCWIVHRRRRP